MRDKVSGRCVLNFEWLTIACNYRSINKTESTFRLISNKNIN